MNFIFLLLVTAAADAFLRAPKANGTNATRATSSVRTLEVFDDAPPIAGPEIGAPLSANAITRTSTASGGPSLSLAIGGSPSNSGNGATGGSSSGGSAPAGGFNQPQPPEDFAFFV